MASHFILFKCVLLTTFHGLIFYCLSIFFWFIFIHMFTMFIRHNSSSRSLTFINIYLLEIIHPLETHLYKYFTEHLFIGICAHLSTFIYGNVFCVSFIQTLNSSYLSNEVNRVVTNWLHTDIRFIAFYHIFIDLVTRLHILHMADCIYLHAIHFICYL